MGQPKSLKNFVITENNDTLEVGLKFNKLTQDMQKEFLSFFSTIFFATGANIRLFLGNLDYLNKESITFLLQLGRELGSNNRVLYLRETPESLKRYIISNQLDRFMIIES